MIRYSNKFNSELFFDCLAVTSDKCFRLVGKESCFLSWSTETLKKSYKSATMDFRLAGALMEIGSSQVISSERFSVETICYNGRDQNFTKKKNMKTNCPIGLLKVMIYAKYYINL